MILQFISFFFLINPYSCSQSFIFSSIIFRLSHLKFFWHGFVIFIYGFSIQVPNQLLPFPIFLQLSVYKLFLLFFPSVNFVSSVFSSFPSTSLSLLVPTKSAFISWFTCVTWETEKLGNITSWKIIELSLKRVNSGQSPCCLEQLSN